MKTDKMAIGKLRPVTVAESEESEEGEEGRKWKEGKEGGSQNKSRRFPRNNTYESVIFDHLDSSFFLALLSRCHLQLWYTPNSGGIRISSARPVEQHCRADGDLVIK
jgi:hypothetical protein